MKLHELNYGRVYKNAVDRYAPIGERIPVKVLQFNPEQRLIHVSRKRQWKILINYYLN